MEKVYISQRKPTRISERGTGTAFKHRQMESHPPIKSTIMSAGLPFFVLVHFACCPLPEDLGRASLNKVSLKSLLSSLHVQSSLMSRTFFQNYPDPINLWNLWPYIRYHLPRNQLAFKLVSDFFLFNDLRYTFYLVMPRISFGGGGLVRVGCLFQVIPDALDMAPDQVSLNLSC